MFLRLRLLSPQHYGPGTYQLPCAAPRDDWDFALKDEFVITAWWPPTMNVIHDYAAAHFNMLLGGDMLQVSCVDFCGELFFRLKLIVS